MVQKKFVLLVTILIFCDHGSDSSKVKGQELSIQENLTSKEFEYLEEKDKTSQSTSGPTNELPEAVILFNEFAEEEVRRCKILGNLFNVEDSVNLEELQAAVFFLVTTFTVQAGYQYSADDATTAIRYIINRCDKISPEVLLTVYSHTVARYLANQNVLTTENAEKLSISYMNTTKDVAKRIAKEEYPRSKVTAILIGVLTFLRNQNVFTTEGLPQVSTLYADEWNYHLNVNATEDSVPTSTCPIAETYSRKRNPALIECEYVCRIKLNYIKRFASVFERAVKSSQTLTDLFTLPSNIMSPKIFSRGNFYVSLRFLEQGNELKAPYLPPYLADFMSRFIRNAKSMNFDLLVSVHSNFMAKYLKSEKVLNAKNAESLAVKYAKTLEEQAKLIVDKRYPNSKVVAIQFGYWSFLSVSGGKNLAKFAFYYGNEWKCETKSAVKE